MGVAQVLAVMFAVLVLILACAASRLDAELIAQRVAYARLEISNAALSKQNERLIETLAPALKRHDKPEKTAEDIVKAKHSIGRGSDWAKCSCGWHFNNDDPVRLQQEIAAHHSQFNPTPISSKRGWAQGRKALEAAEDEQAAVQIAKEAKQ